jgi:hypothetical protein
MVLLSSTLTVTSHRSRSGSRLADSDVRDLDCHIARLDAPDEDHNGALRDKAGSGFQQPDEVRRALKR